jgi:hypothetical protein
MTDFYSTVYYPVRALLTGENPHDRDRFMALYPVADMYGPYLPLNLVIHLPFGLLPPALGAATFFVVTILLTVALAALVLRLVGLRAGAGGALLLAALILLSRPGHWNLLLGQLAIELTIATYVAVAFAAAAPVIAGMGLAVALIKPTYGLPLAVLMLARGSWRPVVVAGAITAVVSAPFLLLFAHRTGGSRAFIEEVISGYRAWQDMPNANPAISIVRIDAISTISRFWGHPLPGFGQAALTVVVVAIAAVAVRVVAKRGDVTGTHLSTAIIILALLLASSHLGYDLLLVTWPFVFLVLRGLPGMARGGKAWWGVVGLFALLALNWLTTEAVFSALQLTGSLWLTIASINGVVLMLLFGIYLMMALNYQRRAQPDVSST